MPKQTAKKLRFHTTPATVLPSPQLLRQNAAARALAISDALQSYLVADVMTLICLFSVQQLILVVGGRGEDAGKPILSFDPATDRWTEVAQFADGSVAACGGVVIGDRIHLCGEAGTGLMVVGIKTLKPAHRTLDIGTWQSTDLPPCPAPQCYRPAAVALDGNLYLFAGSLPECSLFCFLPAHNVWEMRSRSSSSTAKCKGAVLDGHLFALGGETTAVQRYTPATDKWSDCAPLSKKRLRSTAVAAQDSLFVCGGADGDNKSCERYLPEVERWVPFAPLLHGRSNPFGVFIDGRIFVCGGTDPSPADHSPWPAESYDLSSNTWTIAASMPVFRHSALCFAVNP